MKPRRAALLWTLGLVLWLALTVSVAASGPPTGLDREAARSIAASVTSSDYDWSIPITDLGGAYVIVTVLVVAAGALLLLRRWREAVVLVLAVSVTHVAVQLTKALVYRPRHGLGPLTEFADFSYPSGHAAASVALYGLLVWFASRWIGGRVRIALAVVGTALVLAIGASRIYLGAHYPSDVVGGWLAGALCAVAVYAVATRALGPKRDRRGQRAPARSRPA